MENIDRMVEAQNKTTIAVRSLLEIIRLYLIGSILVGLFIGLEVAKAGMYYTDGFWALPFWFLAALIAVIMLFVTIQIISRALASSKP